MFLIGGRHGRVHGTGLRQIFLGELPQAVGNVLDLIRQIGRAADGVAAPRELVGVATLIEQY